MGSKKAHMRVGHCGSSDDSGEEEGEDEEDARND